MFECPCGYTANDTDARTRRGTRVCCRLVGVSVADCKGGIRLTDLHVRAARGERTESRFKYRSSTDIVCILAVVEKIFMAEIKSAQCRNRVGTVSERGLVG